MKKRKILICFLAAAFSVVLFFVSSDVKAESEGNAKKDLAATLHISGTGLPVQKSGPTDGKEQETKSLRGVSVPLKEGLNAFFDFTSPVYQGLLVRDNRTKPRAVVGFHIRLR